MAVKLLALAAFVAVAQAILIPENEWLAFKTTHNKHYVNKIEEQMRLRIFTENVKEINQHNAKFEQGLSTYQRGINQLTDMTIEEIKTNLMGFKLPENQGDRKERKLVDKIEDLQDTVDWREIDGVVTPVKDQGMCGSCWAFSSTGGIEGQYKIKKDTSVNLSEQNLVDCNKKNDGCHGGWMEIAFDYVKIGGIDTETGYPYKGFDQTCKFDNNSIGAYITGYEFVQKNNELELQAAVAKIGPIPIAFDAGHQSFRDYNSGIWEEPSCGTDSFTHAVLVVGYGTEKGIDYWLVKNSWDVTWGMAGYFKMRRNYKNMCGVAGHAVYPLV